MAKFPEIAKLEEFISVNAVVIALVPGKGLDEKSYYPQVEFQIRNKVFKLFVDDEFDDLKLNKTPLSLCVDLREIEGVSIEGPYPNWCKALNLDASNAEVPSHYDNLQKVSKELKTQVGSFDSTISDYDFTLNAGAAQELRERY